MKVVWGNVMWIGVILFAVFTVGMAVTSMFRPRIIVGEVAGVSYGFGMDVIYFKSTGGFGSSQGHQVYGLPENILVNHVYRVELGWCGRVVSVQEVYP